MSTNTELIGCVQHDCAKCKAQADAIEALEAQLKNASVSAIAEAAEVDRMKAEVERLTTLAHGQHIELYNARLQLAAAQGQRDQIADRMEAAYDDSKPSMELMKEAQAIVESKQVFKKFIRGTPLENDIAIWMAEFAEEKLLAAPIAQQPSVPEGWKQAVALAYGHLWHVNNEPMAPIPLRSSETAAYEARKQLRDLLTHEERGLAINQVQAMLAAAPQPKETATYTPPKINDPDAPHPCFN